MITVNGDWFALETANTGYYLGVRGGLVENLHRALSLQSRFAQSHWLCFLSVQGAYPLETKPC